MSSTAFHEAAAVANRLPGPEISPEPLDPDFKATAEQLGRFLVREMMIAVMSWQMHPAQAVEYILRHAHLAVSGNEHARVIRGELDPDECSGSFEPRGELSLDYAGYLLDFYLRTAVDQTIGSLAAARQPRAGDPPHSSKHAARPRNAPRSRRVKLK